MGDLSGLQTGLRDGIGESDIRVRGGITHEATQLAVDARFQIDLRQTGDLAAQSAFGKLGHEADAGPAFLKGRGDGGQIIAQTGDDARSGDNDSAHDQKLVVSVNRPTLRSVAV